MLRTWDFSGTIDFYTKVLGFECRARSDEWAWALLAREGVELMLSGPNEHLGESKAAFTGSLYFNVDDVDAVWAELKDKARVEYPLENFDYGMREFAIYDNNGYLLQFGQEITPGSGEEASHA